MTLKCGRQDVPPSPPSPLDVYVSGEAELPEGQSLTRTGIK